jgi:hypothetical protein
MEGLICLKLTPIDSEVNRGWAPLNPQKIKEGKWLWAGVFNLVDNGRKGGGD